MGMQIWIPRGDRTAALAAWRGERPPESERLPLHDDDTTLRTIEPIEVLWLRGRSIHRAFEVEHTTSVYSRVLRIADRLARQPNMDNRLPLVAPTSRREQVFQRIRRPVCSRLERGPLADSCRFLSYNSVWQLAAQPHLVHLSDRVLDGSEEEVTEWCRHHALSVTGALSVIAEGRQGPQAPAGPFGARVQPMPACT